VEGIGYKVPLTQTCDETRPPLIVPVATTPADNLIQDVHQSLHKGDLLPSEHWVDQGYTDSPVLVHSQRESGVTVVGPVADDPSWPARAGAGFDKSPFPVDGEHQTVTCPAGKQSLSFLPNTDPQNGMRGEARFARQHCAPCRFRSPGTKAKKEPRLIRLQEREQYEARQAARQRPTTAEFRQQYPPEPVLRVRMNKRSGAAAGAGAAIWDRPRPSGSTS
jgi:transposase